MIGYTGRGLAVAAAAMALASTALPAPDLSPRRNYTVPRRPSPPKIKWKYQAKRGGRSHKEFWLKGVHP